jgi:hypothetical protein
MDNLVAACRSCNGSKGDREAPKPIEKPRRAFNKQTVLFVRSSENANDEATRGFFQASHTDPQSGFSRVIHSREKETLSDAALR